MENIYKFLEQLGIKYKEYIHPAVFTVEQANQVDAGIEAVHTKNLFLRNQKGDKFYLLIIEGNKRADLKKLQNILGEKKLSFGSPEYLYKYLGVTPGSVSVFAVINDSEGVVEILVDETVFAGDKVGFHPNINTATLVISTENLKKFLLNQSNRVRYINL